jgi:GNAT superfamily N-acetyltransferase
VELLRLWALLFDEGNAAPDERWRSHAAEWFTRAVNEPRSARFPVIEVDGSIVATAIGTLELGVPNPHCIRGRTVRLMNVITLAEHRGHGYGTRLILDVVEWARSIDADRAMSLSRVEDRLRGPQSRHERSALFSAGADVVGPASRRPPDPRNLMIPAKPEGRHVDPMVEHGH